MERAVVRGCILITRALAGRGRQLLLTHGDMIPGWGVAQARLLLSTDLQATPSGCVSSLFL